MTNKSKIFLQGMFFCGLIALMGFFVWLNLPAKNWQNPKELTLDESISRIESKNAKEITIRQDILELTTKSGEKFTTKIDSSYAVREEILSVAKDAGTTVRLEPASSGWGWLVVINAMPFIILTILLVLTIFFAIKYNDHLRRKVEK